MKIGKPKAAVAVSGGVDSSVAALMLKKKGYEPIGLFMDLGIGQEQAENAAREVCSAIGMSFHKVDLKKEFKKEIIGYFLDSYKQGLTPNPCVKCNNFIKFGSLLEQAGKLGAQFLVTGHYVASRKSIKPIKSVKSICKLYRAKDKGKDQSYFLYTLNQKQLGKIIFPLGNFMKEDIRKMADEANLPYVRKESQDVCFLNSEGGIMRHNEFLKKNLKALKGGPIKTVDGTKIGEHEGLPLYTIGQRRGVKIGGIGPFYAYKADWKTNTLYVVKSFDDPMLYGGSLIAEDLNWIAGKIPSKEFDCQAVIRYRHPQVKCRVAELKKNLVKVSFKDKQRAITPGQSIVFYKGNEMLGGGIIK